MFMECSVFFCAPFWYNGAIQLLLFLDWHSNFHWFFIGIIIFKFFPTSLKLVGNLYAGITVPQNLLYLIVLIVLRRVAFVPLPLERLMSIAITVL